MQFPWARLATGALFLAVVGLLAASARAQTVVPPVPLTPLTAEPPPGRRGTSEVSLYLTVSASGEVTGAEVVAVGDPELDARALAAARAWTFQPATRAGKPVAARIAVQVGFAAAPAPVGVTHPGLAKASVPSPPPAAPAPREITVRGRLAAPSAGVSDLRVDVGELARVPRKNAGELLQLAPGVYLSNEGGEGHADRLYLRGFDAREGQDIELSVDGIPINESGNFHGNGSADTGFLIPELVRGLRVLEGPFDPRQGNYAVAGSAEFETGLEQRGLTARYGIGSFGAKRALLLFGPSGASSATYGAAEIYETDGYGQNRDAKRARVMAQYQGELGEHGSFRVNGAAYGIEYHSAGVLRKDDVDAGRQGFFDTYDSRQGGNSSRFQLGADLEQRVGSTVFQQQFFLIRRGVRLRENLTGFLLDSQTAIQTPHAQRGDLFDLRVDETTYGARGFARTDLRALGRTHQIELGYFARGDDVESTRQRLDTAGVPYKTDADLDAQLGDLGLYAEFTLRPLQLLSLKAGVRKDLFLFDVLDRCAVQSVSRPSPTAPPGDASCLAAQRFGTYREPEQRSSTASSKAMPRATLTLGPFRHFVYSMSYGEGVRSIDPVYVSQDIATPFASIRAVDGGVAYAHDLGVLSVSARSVFFRTQVDRDLAFSETEGRSVLGGGTTRTGWNGLVRLHGDFFDQSANASLVRSTLDETGLLVPYAPDLVIRSDSVVFGELPLRLGTAPLRGTFSAGLGYLGQRALPFGQRSDATFTLDTGASLAWRDIELELEVTNVLDTRYRAAELNYASDFRSKALPTLVPARHFAAGAPREFFLSLAVTLAGGSP